MPDRRTGYYVASRDWPVLPCPIPLEDTYRALEGITDEDVDAAMASLADAGERSLPGVSAGSRHGEPTGPDGSGLIWTEVSSDKPGSHTVQDCPGLLRTRILAHMGITPSPLRCRLQACRTQRGADSSEVDVHRLSACRWGIPGDQTTREHRPDATERNRTQRL